MTNAPAPLFDTRLARHYLARAVGRGVADFLLIHAATEICERLAAVHRRFGAILDCGTPIQDLAERLVALLQPQLLIRMAPLPQTAGQNAVLGFVGETENLALASEKFDLAISVLALQAVNDLPGALIQLRLVLKPDGLFLGCLLGGATLQELRTALGTAEAEIYGGVSPRIAPFADVRDMGGLLQRARFALPVADSETLTVRYDNMFGLLKDLRAMGGANALTARRCIPVGKRYFARAAEIYADRFADPDGRVRATFELIYLSGWAPHESQQKPLAPGSAKMRLADALKTKPTQEP